MKPTTDILENVRKNSAKNNDEVFTRLYRYMLRPDLYYIAYKNLYPNKGASTKGVDNDTADGFSKEKVDSIIQSLATGTYMPKPARRVYIKKANGKLRPLGIPTFTDKLVQEVLRTILESVYEPVFLDCSHGFRPKRSCTTALKSLKKSFTGIRWFVEGDIKGCFDNIDHQVLVNIIGSKIKDVRLNQLIWKMLKVGYIDDWKYYNTFSGTPQGGIASPIFANIYLHELDKFVMKQSADFNKAATKKYTDEYKKLLNGLDCIRQKMKRAEGEERKALIAHKKAIKKVLLKTPSKSQTDKRLCYIRYADDFLIGINGDKDDCIQIKQELSSFIRQTLKMELSEEKTLITHSNQYARFLGYDVRIRRDQTIRPKGDKGYTQRTFSNMTELNVPLDDKIMSFLFNRCIIKQDDEKIKPIHRKYLLHCTELEIVSAYNAELRGICNYYSIASNFSTLKYFAYLMEYSCLLTLCAKHKSTIGKIKTLYKDGKGQWGIPYKNAKGETFRRYFAYYLDCKNTKQLNDNKPTATMLFSNSRNTFETRLKAKKCELCGSTDSEHYEIHHIHKVKDLKGKQPWERMMIAKRRKTMVVCRECHHEIHK